jgi:hypothetical protein
MSEKRKRQFRRWSAAGLISAVPIGMYSAGLLVVNVVQAAEDGHVAVDGNTLLPLSLFAAGVGAVFYAGKQWQNVCDRLTILEREFLNLKCGKCDRDDKK